MSDEIKIDKGVPVAPVGPGSKDSYPFGTMEHGDSFFVAGEGKALATKIWNRFAYWKKKYDGTGTIKVRKVDGGYRVWRVLE